MEIDGKKLLEQIMYSTMAKDPSTDKDMLKILSVFEKHNVGFIDAMAILIELSFILNNSKGEE